MKLVTLLSDLSTGNLRELPQFGEGSGTVTPAGIPIAINAANGALEALYQRFPLETRMLVLEAIDGVHIYPLRSEFALTSGSSAPIKYIRDSVTEPFQDDLLAIEAVYDADMVGLRLNDALHPDAVSTPGYDILGLPHPKTGDRYYISYRAAHPKLAPNADPATTEIRVPTAALNAFKAHIAYCVFGGMGMEGALAKSQRWLQAYEGECQRLELANTLNQSMVDDNVKPQLRGWP